MNGIDDLRRTLGQHADAVHDHGLADRGTQVHQRVRRVRRQRVAGVGVAAVLAVAATSAVTLWPDGGGAPTPADRRLVGKVAPGTLGSLGYTYAFERGVVGGPDRTTVRLQASDQPRLISWGSREDDGVLKVVDPGHEAVLSAQTGFTDFTVVQPGIAGTWEIQGRDTAAAVYDLTSARPAGYTVDGITFREETADGTLVTARIGDRGQADLRDEVELPQSGRLSLSWFCTGGDRHTWLHVGVKHAVGSEGSTCQDEVFDPGSAVHTSVSSLRFRGEKGTSVRMWATEGRNGPVVDDADLQMGYGFYLQLPRDTRLAGSSVPQTVEHDGHFWGLASTVASDPGERGVSTSNLGAAQALVAGYFAHTGGRVDSYLDGRQSTSYGRTGLGGSGGLGLLAPGSAARLEIVGDGSPRALLGLALYERQD